MADTPCGHAFHWIYCDLEHCTKYQECGQDYFIFRNKVLARDDYKCTKCGIKKNLHVHHVQRRKTHPELIFDPDNCITLCAECHKQVHEEAQRRYDDWVYDNYDEYDDYEEVLCSECRINYHSSRFKQCYKCHIDPGWFMY